MGSTASKKSTKKAANKKPAPTQQMKDFVSWFEIPALNIQRAVAFYDHIYRLKMEISESNGYAMAFFPAKKGIGGAIVAGAGCVPNDHGPLVYLNGGRDLNDVLGRVDEAGGRVVMPKTLISKESGYFALFIDSEGNRMALHSNH